MFVNAQTLITLAAVLAAAMLAGCSGKQNTPADSYRTAAPSGATAVPGNTPHAADPADYDNSVAVTDGKVEGSAFNWLYFKGKSGAGREAEIEINSTTNGQESHFTISGGPNGFTLNGDLGKAEYAYLLTFTADFADDPDVSSAEISVLTNDPDISAEDFFGGAVPADARIGDTTELGIVVFTDYR